MIRKSGSRISGIRIPGLYLIRELEFRNQMSDFILCFLRQSVFASAAVRVLKVCVSPCLREVECSEFFMEFAGRWAIVTVVLLCIV